MVLEKTLESPLDRRRSNQSILKEILIGRTDAEAEAPVPGHMMGRADSLEKPLMLGKTEGGGEGGDRG